MASPGNMDGCSLHRFQAQFYTLFLVFPGAASRREREGVFLRSSEIVPQVKCSDRGREMLHKCPPTRERSGDASLSVQGRRLAAEKRGGERSRG